MGRVWNAAGTGAKGAGFAIFGLVFVIGYIAAGLAFLGILIVGVGGDVAAAELPFGVGPFSTKGNYCVKLAVYGHSLSSIPTSGTPTQSQVRSIADQTSWLIKHAPDRSIKNALGDWLAAEGYGTASDVKSSGHQINVWYSNNCKSADMAIPGWLNGITGWNGVIGDGVGYLLNPFGAA